MSIQIQIAQDEHDDRATIAWLEARGDFLCLPRIVEGPPRPQPLGLLDEDLVIFPVENESLVVTGVKKMPVFDGKKKKKNAASIDARGYYFTWNRTHEARRGVYVVGGADAARFYYEPMKPATPRATTVEKTLKALFRHVRSTTPLTTKGRIPLFIGPHLAARWRAKRATILYPNGSPIPLVRNARASSRAER